MSNLTLIGPRGSGKTTVGRGVAARLGWPLIDTDALVEATAGESIPAIFATRGEPAFRDLESAALLAALRRTPAVIATGGGIVLRSANRDAVRVAGRCVWLTADPQTLWDRIAADRTVRPALTALPGPDEVIALLAAREPLYRATAHLVIDTTGLSPDAVADRILSAWTASP